MKNLLKLSCAVIATMASSHALSNSNFTIDLTSPQPILISQGGSTTVLYTVTNNTNATRSGYIL
jgi:hypothetical protein